ncbi:hypothetical protein [Spirosoma sp.]|uniref:hypothetical protein n=1 Tax=Spirosoma sp. TaxID=1899569 RepID=UPI002606D754|nr:hypothetical protein [Spirosoma sp.]MCX6214032.1 hypothetical protein [Spirosoma sp.]
MRASLTGPTRVPDLFGWVDPFRRPALRIKYTNCQNNRDGTANQDIVVADSKNELPDGTYYSPICLSDGREYVWFLTLTR